MHQNHSPLPTTKLHKPFHGFPRLLHMSWFSPFMLPPPCVPHHFNIFNPSHTFHPPACSGCDHKKMFFTSPYHLHCDLPFLLFPSTSDTYIFFVNTSSLILSIYINCFSTPSAALSTILFLLLHLSLTLFLLDQTTLQHILSSTISFPTSPSSSHPYFSPVTHPCNIIGTTGSFKHIHFHPPRL